MAKSRIDMRHGFMKIIIKNQVDRDNYEKEVQASKAVAPSKILANAPSKICIGSSKAKKPELQSYVPPGIRRGQDELSRQLLFKLEYEDENHEVFTFSVFCNDEPLSVARRVSSERGLSQAMHQALAELIKAEMGKRQALS